MKIGQCFPGQPENLPGPGERYKVCTTMGEGCAQSAAPAQSASRRRSVESVGDQLGNRLGIFQRNETRGLREMDFARVGKSLGQAGPSG